MATLAMTLVAAAFSVVAGLVVGAGVYYAVPWESIASLGSVEPSQRSVRGTAIGLALAAGGTVVFLSATVAALAGVMSVAAMGLLVFLGVGFASIGFVVPMGLLLLDVAGGS